MLKRIQNLYAQRGHMFYRDGLTYNSHSAGSFYHSFYCDHSNEIILASTFQNMGKMLDKNATYSMTASLMSTYGLPPSVWRPVALMDIAQRYLFTTDPNYKDLLNPKMMKNLSELSESELKYFKEHAYFDKCEKIAENDIKNQCHFDSTFATSMITTFMTIVPPSTNNKLSEDDWKTLENCLQNLYHSSN